MLSKHPVVTKLYARLVRAHHRAQQKQQLISLGQSSIQGQCPVCDHSPLTPDLCKPSKAVRTTAKAYLKTAEKKLADERLKAAAAAAPVASSAPSEPPTPVQESQNEETGASSISLAEPHVKPVEVQQDLADQPQPSIEVGWGWPLQIPHS